MFGVQITSGPVDWEIFQHHDGVAMIQMEGNYQVPEAAIMEGVASATPVFRILKEENHEIMVDWTAMVNIHQGENWSGTWNSEVKLKLGGLYLLETGLDTWSTNGKFHWIFRGDTRRHLGVGNLFIIAGQSNAAGYGRDACYDVPVLGVHFFRNNAAWEIASHPLNDGTDALSEYSNIEMGISGTSPYLSFAKEFLKVSHAPVGLIPTALGGSSIRRWVKSEEGDLYRNLLNRLSHLGPQHKRFAALLWYQGCSDATEEEALYYGKRFESFIHELREDLQKDLPVFTYQLNRELNSSKDHAWGLIREFQRQASRLLEGVFLLPTHDSLLCDGIHNNSEANVRLGERLAKQCAGVLLGEEAYFAPEPKKLVKTGEARLTLTCAHCKYGLQLFDSPDKSNGFAIMEGERIIPVIKTEIDKDFPDTIHLVAAEKISEKATLSYCWEANPSYRVFVEKSNYLPIVAFYKLEVHTNDH